MIGSYLYEALLIGGRSGAGKSTVTWEVSAQLQAAHVAHCVIDGDLLDFAHPAPRGDPDRTRLTEDNLAALWRNYAGLGYRRMIYTNTVSVLESEMIARALGAATRVTAVMLTASDDVVYHRLAAREVGSQFGAHLERSEQMARQLDAEAPAWVVRVPTDGRTVMSIAHEVIAAARWVI